jgi:hypothetical protein
MHRIPLQPSRVNYNPLVMGSLALVRASCRSGRASAVYHVEGGVATLLHRTDPRGHMRSSARRFLAGGEAL